MLIRRRRRPSEIIRNFLRLESTGGIILVGAAVLAMLLANLPLSNLYTGLVDTPVEVRVGALKIAKPLLLWINDGLMAIFFLLIGLEVKREILEGQLSSFAQVLLPALAAVGGMVVPALIYVFLNLGDPAALNGWAIPAATDIAFALGVLILLGDRVPESLKIFLLTLAILDDLAAIIIIAIFYSGDLSVLSLSLAAVALVILFLMNRIGITQLTPYILIGIVLWVLVLKSGVHATLAGVALAFAIPLRSKNEQERSPLRFLEHKLHPWVAFGILPVFAFANAGIPLTGVSFNTLLGAVPLGIILGLSVGKPVGIFGLATIGIKTGLVKLPERATWLQLFGVAWLCGIGFTMSLFIASLAFEHGATQYFKADRLGILVASLISAVLGYAVLRLAPSSSPQETEEVNH